MFPTIAKFGPITLHSYGLMLALGFIVALQLVLRDVKRAGIDPNPVSDMMLWGLVIGVAATRVLHIVMFPEGYSWSDPIGWINVTNGGLVFQGAVPAVMLYAWWGLRRRKLPFFTIADCVTPYILLAQAFGRMGCFFNGCCFGKRAEHLAWAVRFPEDSPAYRAHLVLPDFPHGMHTSFPVHPAQLYTVLLLLAAAGAMLLLRSKWRPYVGFTFPLYLVFEGGTRFIVEFFRGDGNPTSLGLGLISNQQVFALGMALFGIVLFFYLRSILEPKAPPEKPAK